MDSKEILKRAENVVYCIEQQAKEAEQIQEDIRLLHESVKDLKEICAWWTPTIPLKEYRIACGKRIKNRYEARYEAKK